MARIMSKPSTPAPPDLPPSEQDDGHENEPLGGDL